MDEPKPKTPLFDARGQIGADTAPIAVDEIIVALGPDQAEAPANPPRKSSHAVYCDNEQEVREGFAIALRAMGFERDQ